MLGFGSYSGSARERWQYRHACASPQTFWRSLMIDERQEGRKLTLPDGVVVPVRTIRSDDAPALQRLYSRLSEQSSRLRFFHSMKKLSDQKAKDFAQVDGIRSSPEFSVLSSKPDPLYCSMSATPLVARCS